MFKSLLALLMLAVSPWAYSAPSSFLFSSSPTTVTDFLIPQQRYQRELNYFQNMGFTEPLKVPKNDLADDYPGYFIESEPTATAFGQEGKVITGLRLLVKDDRFNTPIVSEFLTALSNHKQKISSLYKLNNVEYNKLAMMAFAILGRETDFGTGERYQLKSVCRWCVRAARMAQRFDGTIDPLLEPLSSGLTQIKTVPALIQAHYKITKDSLDNPTNSAIATVGFLAETLIELKRRVTSSKNSDDFQLKYINNNNIYDYISYLYNGRVRKLYDKKNPPKPHKLGYNRELKSYLQLLALLESQPEQLLF
jgi:hypothetical protein